MELTIEQQGRILELKQQALDLSRTKMPKKISYAKKLKSHYQALDMIKRYEEKKNA